MEYDVIIVGGGHAGIEAANAAAKLGVNTALITTKIATIGKTPCNPSIGGPAKGNVVLEIDALGGLMGKITNKSLIQLKTLNNSKGPAVRALRAQIDNEKYPKEALKELEKLENLAIIEDFIDEVIVKENEVIGLRGSEVYKTNHVVITTGTYLDSYIIKGTEKISSGPDGLKTSSNLANSLKNLGLNMLHLKTGTPARVKSSSIDFSKGAIAPGDEKETSFSYWSKPDLDFKKQRDCYLIYTTPKTHQIILDNISLSAYDSGLIEGVGARYCPSIEDKLVRFSDKKRHQIFLEPETKRGDVTYVQGFSTSMPENIQSEMVHSLPGLEKAEILKYGYAIEYEALFPEQLKQTLESKKIKGLYTAGQINGTSGYEEAAGQGIVAGINAALAWKKKEPLILTRSNSYIGVMIDDLITKGTKEPYRLLTSRAEYRLLLRNDNADERLTPQAYKIGMINDQQYSLFKEKEKKIKELLNIVEKLDISPKEITEEITNKMRTVKLTTGIKLSSFLKRPNIKLLDVYKFVGINEIYKDVFLNVEILLKYEGYIKKLEGEVNKIRNEESKKIPNSINYQKISNLALEAREKLTQIKPETIGQASRIPGVNPVDISVLLLYLNRGEK